MTAATARPQTAMKRLAGALSFVCLVLFLLAIEQKHTVAAVEALRDGTVPAVRRIGERAAQMASGAGVGLGDLGSGAVRQISAWRSASADQTESAGIAPGGSDMAPPAALPDAGSLTLVRAELRFGNGDRVRTRPLRIAWGRDAFAPGQTFAARLNAPPDAQIELREVVAPAVGQATAPLKLCGGDPAGVAAVLHRRDRIQVMLFRSSTVGARTSASALCGVWSFPSP